MFAITNPAMLSYGYGKIKYGIFKNVPFLTAYWKDKNDVPAEFINLIQLSCNRMDFPATKMTIKDRKDAFIYLSIFTEDEDDKYYYASADPMQIKNDASNFIGYITFRAKDIGTLSKYSKLLIGDMYKFDIKTIYKIPIDAYRSFKEATVPVRSNIPNEFLYAYETFKTNIIAGLVNYQEIFE